MDGEVNLTFPADAGFDVLRRPGTGGALLSYSGLVRSPGHLRVLSAGASRQLGLYAVLHSAPFQKFFRLMLLSSVDVSQGQYLKPGEALGAAAGRLYYDVMQPGPRPLHLPGSLDEAGLYVPLEAYHQELLRSPQ